MLISRNHKAEDWKAPTFRTEEDWEKAVEIFLDRIQTRYLEHIDRIIGHHTSGFAVLALDCTLIETLEQFRRGKRKTPSKKGEAYFVAFLTGTSFRKHFGEDTAKMFYRQIRCGLLHQTETLDSRVKRNSKLPMMAHTKGKNGLYRLWPGAPSNTTSAKSPVVSPEFVLSFPYPTAKVTVSLAFNSTCPE
jgi:hypothetical protein